MGTLHLTPPVFSILSGLIEERSGLHYGPSDLEILQEKASSRAQEAGFESLLDYYYFLRYDVGGEKELEELIENLVVGETYFFREWPSIEVLVDAFIAPWCSQGRRPRILSAACSTGEEPLSLAMLLDDRRLLDRVEIVAFDINSKALEKAKNGRYGRRSLRHVPDQKLAERYIRPDKDGHLVTPELIKSIQWKRRNLLSNEGFEELGVFDAILCRNVLIYFSDQTIKSVLSRLSRALVHDGILLVGVSESLLRYGGGLMVEEKGNAFVYRKAAP